MPPNPYQRMTEIRNLKNPRLPEMFFTATEEQIVVAIMEMGYERAAAEEEAHQFITYREGLTTKQVWPDDDEAPVEKVAEYKDFASAMREMKTVRE